MTFTANPYAMQDRALAARQADEAAQESQYDFWDREYPEWEIMSREPEDRREVDYSDVYAPEVTVVVGFGGDHRRVIFGAHE